MAEITEIRWHGRGGQGAKTVALLFADAALATGKQIQAFPEYGPERMGAPVRSFNRLSDGPITLHCSVDSPSIVIVLDETLCKSVDVTAGLPKDGILLINTAKNAAYFKELLKFSGKVYAVDASQIAIQEIGMNKPNTPMLGALVKASGILDFDKMIQDTEQKLAKKFAHKPEVIKGNVNAIKRAYAEVKS
ncbi:MAG: pyruvate synthase [Candidatus Margulisiibacteriota bacterium]|nr:MAG: pyruvate synthase [Candidatus Margulisbacteria bacterium GWD2_39_127]OGI05427.1 MAG: pyruvate synthase [Candidatus Margulisbacteria bacterium GWF2_38_17]OGI07835.1 MAG: pyruvate synthase [Candidatus Margulisbacteria bacterium GWE2_39_32]PZM80109.1 MAG: pyruvate synthase [Candidatus Margulisiibacteriota bacterium]HAR62626.1 pyruvate synthase [Candidatus Margulisiibacteriota bacterium]